MDSLSAIQVHAFEFFKFQLKHKYYCSWNVNGDYVTPRDLQNFSEELHVQ